MHRTEGTGNVLNKFTGGPPGTCLTPEWLNAVQEEICHVIESAGLTVQTAGTDTRGQLLQALSLYLPLNQWDVVVTSQAQFNALFTRQGANHYHIADAYKSVLIRNLGVGYQCSGPLSFLSGGDTWAYIQTNNCVHFKMENGAYLSVGSSAFYMETNTDNCKMENVWIKGDDSSGTLSRSFLLNAYRVTYDNCKTSNRSSSTAFAGFEYSVTVGHNYTSKYTYCSMFLVAGIQNTNFGFMNCYNLSNCSVSSCSTTGTGAMVSFYGCHNLSNCTGYDITSGWVSTGFSSCYILSSCTAIKLDAVSVSQGFAACAMLSSCFVQDIDCSAGDSQGFTGCIYMSACQSDDIDCVGGVAEGFKNSSYGSACYTTESVNSGNDYFCSLDAQITHKESTPQVFT